jgi:hypothetical protein
MSEQMGRIVNKIKGITSMIKRGESDLEMPRRHRAAIESIIQTKGLSREEILNGALDGSIKRKFARHLAAEYSASAAKIEQHADHKWRRVLSFAQTSIGYGVGAAAAAGLVAAAPKLSLLIGAGAEGFVSQVFGMNRTASWMPALVGAGFLAVPFLSLLATRRLTRIPREGREAGNILRKAMADPTELARLRETVADGRDVFAEFDRIYEQKRSTWKSKALWSGLMLTGSIAGGTWGAGAFKEFDIVQQWINSPEGRADLMRNPTQFAKTLSDKMTAIPWKAPATGINEISTFLQNFWTNLFSARPPVSLGR